MAQSLRDILIYFKLLEIKQRVCIFDDDTQMKIKR